MLTGIGHRPRGHHDELRSRLATAEERRILELTRTARDHDGIPVAVLHQVRRADGATFTYDINYPGR